MAQIDELVVKVRGDIRDLKSKLNQSSKIANSTFSKIGRSVKRFTRPLGNALSKVNNLTGAIGIAAGAAGLGAIIKKSLDSADALAKLSGQLGVSAEFLQEMRFAASQTGVEQGKFDQSLRLFTKNIGEANDGVVTFTDEFDKLGVSITDSSGNIRKTEEIFKDVADGLKGMESDTERASTAFALFGRSGILLTNTFKDGAAGITKYQQEARSLGIVIEGSLLKNAEAANDKFDVLSRVISVQVVSAVVDLAPHLTALAQLLVESSQGAIQFGKDIGLIDEKVPIKKLNSLKAEVIDLEQKLMRLKNADFTPRQASQISDATKELAKLKEELISLESVGGGDAGESAKAEEDNKTRILADGIKNREEMKKELMEKELAAASKATEDKIARIQEENLLLAEIDYANNEEKIKSNKDLLDGLEKDASLSKDARLKIEADRISAERSMQDAALGGLSTTFSNIVSLTKGQNRELFELSKAAATATAIVQGVLGVQRALGSAPPPLNFISAAAVGTSAAVNVAKIQGTAFNRGTDYVPGIGTTDTVPAILTPGERVVPRETNRDLTSFLKNGKSSASVSVSMTNNFNGLSIDTDEAKLQLAEALNDVVRELGAKVII